MAEDRELHLTETQLLMLASMVDKMAHVERRVTVAEMNGHDKFPWMKYASTLLWVLFSVLSILFWDMRSDLRQVRDEQMLRKASIDVVRKLETVILNTTLEFADMKSRIGALERSNATQSERLMKINNRLDRVPGYRPQTQTMQELQ